MIKSDKIKLSVEEDLRGLRGEPIEEIFEVVDAVLIKGLTTNR